MYQQPVEAQTIADVLSVRSDTAPVHFFAPDRLDARLAEFRRGFPGLVTYAVKANPTEDVLRRLCAGGLDGFDVASPDEIALIRRICPDAPMHYNNPVRSKAEIAAGIAAGVVSWSMHIQRIRRAICLAHEAGLAIRLARNHRDTRRRPVENICGTDVYALVAADAVRRRNQLDHDATSADPADSEVRVHTASKPPVRT